MVRYELILRRYPKLKAAEVPQRMGDLPDELSQGTLQSALDNPEGGPLPIAWGDRRNRLWLIQRRIEILGGSAELIDRAGPLAKWFTEQGDALTARWFSRTDARKKPAGDPTQLSFVGLGLGAVLIAAAVVFARFAHDGHARAHALEGAGFVSGWLMTRLFVRGLRGWFGAQGQRALAAGLVLIPLATLCGAGYQAHALGLIDRSVALMRGGSTQAHKPTMKPFAALLAELHRRKQRAELAAALVSENSAKAKPESPAARPLAAQPEPPTSPSPAADSGKRKTAMNSTQTKTTPAVHPVVRAGLAPACEEPPVFPPRVDALAPAPAVVKRQTLHTPLPTGEAWGPLRSVADINEIHVAIALALAVSTFLGGMWTGRRARRKTATWQQALAEPGPPPVATRADDATPVMPGQLPVAAEPLSPQLMASVNALPETGHAPASARPAPDLEFEPDTSRSLPLVASDLLGAATSVEREWTPDAVPSVERQSRSRATQPPRAPDGVAKPPRDSAVGQARTPEQRRAGAYSARGGVQEELVTRRRDARRDD